MAHLHDTNLVDHGLCSVLLHVYVHTPLYVTGLTQRLTAPPPCAILNDALSLSKEQQCMYTSTHTNLFERRLVCNTHASSHVSYINYHVNLGPLPHCPQCPNSCVPCEYDYADVLVTRYYHPKFTRKVALWCLNELQRLNLDRSPSHQYEIEDIMTELGITTNDTFMSRPKCYLTSHCSSCGGSFTTLYSSIPVQATPPMYCIWCGQQSLSVTQEDTEETAMISLANHYNIPLVLFKHLYDIWHSDSKYQYLSDFITNDSQIQPILNKLRTTV